MGLSYDDFCRLTFEEFEEVSGAWSKGREEAFRGDWERARWVAAALIQPHLKKGSPKRADRIFPLPWDKGAQTTGKTQGESARPPGGPKKTPEQLSARFRALASKMGKEL